MVNSIEHKARLSYQKSTKILINLKRQRWILSRMTIYMMLTCLFAWLALLLFCFELILRWTVFRRFAIILSLSDTNKICLFNKISWRMFRFDNPIYLWLLLLIPLSVIVYLYSIRKRKQRLVKFGNPILIHQLSPMTSKRRGWIKFVLAELILLLLILIIARPQVGSKNCN